MLLDLPDHDSTELSHRLEVDRLVQLVDVLVWVVDPQKYADAALHDRYLKPLAGHADVMMVVLNQADRLTRGRSRALSAPICAGCSPSEGLHGVPGAGRVGRDGLRGRRAARPPGPAGGGQEGGGAAGWPPT